jgi:hypothetical protein
MRRIGTAPRAVRRVHAPLQAGAARTRSAADQAVAGWKVRERML